MQNMRNLLCLLALLAVTAEAGENRYLGRIVVSGSSLTNATTAAPFTIPTGAKITVYCSAAVNLLVDNLSATTTTGLPIAATTLFPTSVGQNKILISGQPSAVVAVIGTANCDFWQRTGDE